MKKRPETWISYFEKQEAKTFLNEEFKDAGFFDDFDRYFKPTVKIKKNNDSSQKKRKQRLPFDQRLSNVYFKFYVFLLCYVVLRGVSLGFYVNTSILTQERDFQGDYCGEGKHSRRPFYYFFKPIGTDQLSIICLKHCPK